MRRPKVSIAINVLCSAVLLLTPLSVAAEPSPDVPTDPSPGVILPPVLITEVQTGNAARADEFIELHNTTDQAIDITGWQLRYVTASATSTKSVIDPSATISLTPAAETTPITLPAQGYYLLYAGSVVLPSGVAGQQFSDMLPAGGGSLVLVRPDNATCEWVRVDALAWGATAHLFGEGEALVAGVSSSNDRLFQRYVAADGAYLDSGSNAADFMTTNAAATPPLATPGAPNTSLSPDVPVAGSGVLSQSMPERFNNPSCEPPAEPEPPVTPPPDDSPPVIIEPPANEPDDEPAPTIPPGNNGLKSPLISELLPNPASPQTDKHDEFIELYNTNPNSFDLSGYILEAGLKTKKRYTIPTGTRLGPRTFLAFFSADTKLALSNSGSQVSLLDPFERPLVTSQVYASAKDGQAWVLAGGEWQWTTRPTPNAVNVISAPPAKRSRKKSSGSVSSTSGTVKGQSTGTGSNTDTGTTTAAPAGSGSALHPGVLALIAVSALLYGAYEYRHDLANKLYQFRSNRAARRATRQGPEGR